MVSILLAIICVLCAVFCHRAAQKKGHPPVFWGVMGFLFGPLALPFVLLLPEKKRESKYPPD